MTTLYERAMKSKHVRFISEVIVTLSQQDGNDKQIDDLVERIAELENSVLCDVGKEGQNGKT